MMSDENYDWYSDVAWANGAKYAQDNHHFEVESPLSGEWAGEINCRDVILDLGLDPDNMDDNDYQALLNRWEEGYRAYFNQDDDD